MRAGIVLVVVVACGGAKAPSPEPPHNESKAAPAALKRGDGFASKEALYAAVMQALRTRSATPILPAVPTLPVVTTTCPGRAEDKDEVNRALAGAIEGTQRKLDECWRAGDLGSATLVEPRDESTKPDHDCPGSTNNQASLAVRAGSLDVIVRVKWVVTKDGRLYLDDPPRCED